MRKRRKSGNVKEITVTVQVSNIGHVNGADSNKFSSLPVYFPTAFASFIDRIINKVSFATTVKYYYKLVFIVNGKDHRKRKFFEMKYSIDGVRKKETEVLLITVKMNENGKDERKKQLER